MQLPLLSTRTIIAMLQLVKALIRSMAGLEVLSEKDHH